MTDDLKTRLTALRSELELAEGPAREELLDHLEQAILGLETQGEKAPGWAKALIASRVEEAVEDMFDNMPV